MNRPDRLRLAAALALAVAPGTVAAQDPAPSRWPSRLHRRDRHAAPVQTTCACEACVPKASTKKSTDYEYRSEDVTKCYVRARCDLPSLLHHEPPAPPQAVAVRKRVLMKRAVPKEEPAVKYEPTTVAVPCTVHRRHGCPACAGG